MKTLETNGRIERGKLVISNRAQFVDALRTWQDCPVTVTVERQHATRSKAQNDYYHSVVVARVADAWSKKLGRVFTVKEAHELLKAQFLPPDMAQRGENGTLINGLVIGGSTTKLNKLQFIEYLESIVGWAAEKWDCFIPDPDPLWREHAESEAA